MARALTEALDDQHSAEEREIFARIEARRGVLLGRTDQVMVLDYGAGSSTDTRSVEEMRKGQSRPIQVGETCRMSSKSPFWGILLFKLISHFQAKSAVELGSCMGLSAAYQCSALKLNNGRLITLEGAPALAAITAETLSTLGLDMGRVIEGPFVHTYSGALTEATPIDFMFIDGHHHGPSTVAYFEQALPHLNSPALLVFDDIAWSDGMREASREIFMHKSVSTSVSFGNVGFTVFDPSMSRKTHYDLTPLSRP